MVYCLYMFKNLTDFSYERNRNEAFGFYVAWGLLSVLLAALVGTFFTLSFNLSSIPTSELSSLGARVGTLVAFFVVLFISVKIAYAKKLLSNFKTIILIVLAGLCALFGGALLGFLIPAYLSTRPVHTGK